MFCCVQKSAEFFLPNLWKKIWNVPKRTEKTEITEKKQDRSLPQFECTFEKTVEKFSAEVRMFKLTVQKILNFWHKSTKTSSLQEKWNTEYFFAEVFLKVWRFSAQSRAMKKHYLCKKIPNCSSVHVFSCFEKITATFCPIFDKKAQVPSKKKWLIKKKQKRSLPHLEYNSKKTVENCSAEAQTFKLTIQKNLNHW